mmetsp:Transcript_34828/g.86909  ORF Transcript_34828/g.86909 Transcript_34828/m.86909 type:complete len:239 (+) Transcript_34828:786-1502(+)
MGTCPCSHATCNSVHPRDEPAPVQGASSTLRTSSCARTPPCAVSMRSASAAIAAATISIAPRFVARKRAIISGEGGVPSPPPTPPTELLVLPQRMRLGRADKGGNSSSSLPESRCELIRRAGVEAEEPVVQRIGLRKRSAGCDEATEARSSSTRSTPVASAQRVAACIAAPRRSTGDVSSPEAGEAPPVASTASRHRASCRSRSSRVIIGGLAVRSDCFAPHNRSTRPASQPSLLHVC